jgi:hypothetical protein
MTVLKIYLINDNKADNVQTAATVINQNYINGKIWNMLAAI